MLMALGRTGFRHETNSHAKGPVCAEIRNIAGESASFLRASKNGDVNIHVRMNSTVVRF
jgi:hypothetical protein